jgi:hypothetical protein
MKQQLAYCGLKCSECEYKEKLNCPGCQKCKGKPFWGSCKVATCCIDKIIQNCGECNEIPCALLKSFSFDKEQGDNGERIKNLQSTE